MDPTDLTTRSEGFVFPLELFEVICHSYFGKGERRKIAPTSGAMVACPEALGNFLLNSYYGEGKSHSDQFGSNPDEEVGDEGGDETSPTDRVMKYGFSPSLMLGKKPQGVAAAIVREQSNVDGHAGPDDGSEGPSSDPETARGT